MRLIYGIGFILSMGVYAFAAPATEVANTTTPTIAKTLPKKIFVRAHAKPIKAVVSQDIAVTPDTNVAKTVLSNDGDDGSFQPHALDVLPEKKIEDADLSAEADRAIREAAARIGNGQNVGPGDNARAASSAAAATINGGASASVVSSTSESTSVTAKAIKNNVAGSQSESSIPVLANYGAKKEAIANPVARVTISLIILGLLAGGLILFSRWYSKKRVGAKDTNKIKILTQHFLGPKKSLAIVRVAGETILIGVTDQNISMIKSLALLDEDIPENTPTNFGRSLEKADQKAIADSGANSGANYDQLEDFVVSNIKDKVFSKLKNLRPL